MPDPNTYTLSASLPSAAVPFRSAARLWPLGIIFLRPLLFAAWQALFALGYAINGSTVSWESSAAWWPYTVSLTNLVCIALMAYILHMEGSSLGELYRFERSHLKSDLLAVAAFSLLAGPIAMLPNFGLANLLFGDVQVAVDLFARPLPVWAAIAGLAILPVTIALAELPVYFGYAMPRLDRLSGSAALGLLLPAAVLSAQHAAMPLLFDGRFLVWRLFMFLPFAIFVGLVLRWRPRLLPYLIVVHGLMDLSLMVMVLQASL